MIFLRRRLPLLITMITGLLFAGQYYVPHPSSELLLTSATKWLQIIGGFALVLGISSLFHQHAVKIRRQEAGWGYSLVLYSGILVTTAAGAMAWGKESLDGTMTGFGWIYSFMMVPLQGTMFAILAFFIASAAYRSFRARSREAAVLLVAAVIVMMGRVPLGEYLLPASGDVSQWILNVLNASVRRAILIGVSLGAIALSFKIIFGVERSYLGGGKRVKLAGPVAEQPRRARTPARCRDPRCARPGARSAPPAMHGRQEAEKRPDMTFSERMLKIDRRIIFLVIGLCTLLPLLYPVGLAIKISPEVRSVYDYMEALPERSVFLLSIDFDPASKPELHPQAIALLRHAFRKNLRVVAMTLWVSGTGMADQLLRQVAQEMGKENAKDYVFLGWSPGGTAVIINMGQDLYTAFPSDYGGKPTKGLPVLDGVNSLKDVAYAISLGAGNPGIEAWYVFGKDKYKFELGGGCTGVIAPGLYPLLRSGQINGLIGGLRGAAEYESLVGQKGRAVAGMDAQSATHFAIIVLVAICNLFYFSLRHQQGQRQS